MVATDSLAAARLILKVDVSNGAAVAGFNAYQFKMATKVKRRPKRHHGHMKLWFERHSNSFPILALRRDFLRTIACVALWPIDSFPTIASMSSSSFASCSLSRAR